MILCRLCDAPLQTTFLDLGTSPPCESYLASSQLDDPELQYPLHVRVCDSCLLVQLPECLHAEDIFSDYAYFSSYSDSWVAHAGRFVNSAIEALQLTSQSLVVEVASNDGYLLQHLVARGIPVLGIEPAENIAEVARAKGVPTRAAFLSTAMGEDVAARHGKADLVVANNVLAHVPDLRDFVGGLRALVSDSGIVALEFPHLQELISGRQYDTIYHEHFSYFTLLTAARALETGGLQVTAVERLLTHGGSLRVWARPMEGDPAISPNVQQVLAEEEALGLHTVVGHSGFAAAVFGVKRDLVEFLFRARSEGRRVGGYGAPGKGNTLLNHCGIRRDLLPYTVDRNSYKQGRYLPGTHIPIYSPEYLAQDQPDYVLILPWNLRDELTQQLSYVREWNGSLVFPIPELEIV